MHKSSHIEISSMIVFLSILTIIVQFTSYYFFTSSYVILGISLFTLTFSNHILLTQSQTYESSFIYSTLTLFISSVIALLTYFGKEQFFPYSNLLLAVIVMNWYIPSIHCLIRNMFDYGNRLENYSSYFRNSSVVFILFYLGIIIYGNFNAEAFPWAYRSVIDQANFTPFWSLATQIEDYLNGLIPISDIIVYLCSRILPYLPYGFYVIVLLRRKPKTIRFISLLILPIMIELLQYIFVPARSDIDDIIYALIGGILGALMFHLTNVIFRAVSGKNFLANSTDFRYSNSSLHF